MSGGASLGVGEFESTFVVFMKFENEAYESDNLAAYYMCKVFNTLGLASFFEVDSMEQMLGFSSTEELLGASNIRETIEGTLGNALEVFVSITLGMEISELGAVVDISPGGVHSLEGGFQSGIIVGPAMPVPDTEYTISYSGMLGNDLTYIYYFEMPE